VSAAFHPQSGRGAARIGQYDGAGGDHGLALVDFRHGACETAEAFLDAAENIVVAAQLAAEQFGNSFPRAIVIGRPQAAATR
jgi:hypothetical protein